MSPIRAADPNAAGCCTGVGDAQLCGRLDAGVRGKLLRVEYWALAISVAAVLVSGVAALYTRAQVREARRANALLEEDFLHRKTREELAELAARVRWQVEGLGNMSYVLRNIGTQDARNVVVTSDSVMFLSGPIQDASGAPSLAAPMIAAGAGIKFTAPGPSAYMGRGHELSVAWEGGPPVAVPMPPPASR